MVEKIVVLAAGKGTRMLELTKDKPKHLIEVGDKPFLYYQFKNLKSAGFNEIILMVGYKKEKMAEFADKYGDEFNLVLVDQEKEMGSQRYGTAIAVGAVEKVVGDKQFIVVNGDDIYSAGDLRRMRELDDNFIYVGGFKEKNPERFGVLKIEGEYLTEVLEKPKVGVEISQEELDESLVNIGLYKFTPEIFEKVREVEKSPRGEYELTDAISSLASEKKAKVFQIKDYWLTFSRPEDIQKMEEFLLK